MAHSSDIAISLRLPRLCILFLKASRTSVDAGSDKQVPAAAAVDGNVAGARAATLAWIMHRRGRRC